MITSVLQGNRNVTDVDGHQKTSKAGEGDFLCLNGITSARETIAVEMKTGPLKLLLDIQIKIQ